MSDLVLGSTTVLSDSSGTPTIQSGVAFPRTGFIIQTVTDTYNGQSTTISTADDYLGTNLEVTIIPKSTSNTLMLEHRTLH